MSKYDNSYRIKITSCCLWDTVTLAGDFLCLVWVCSDTCRMLTFINCKINQKTQEKTHLIKSSDNWMINPLAPSRACSGLPGGYCCVLYPPVVIHHLGTVPATVSHSHMQREREQIKANLCDLEGGKFILQFLDHWYCKPPPVHPFCYQVGKIPGFVALHRQIIIYWFIICLAHLLDSITEKKTDDKKKHMSANL